MATRACACISFGIERLSARLGYMKVDPEQVSAAKEAEMRDYRLTSIGLAMLTIGGIGYVLLPNAHGILFLLLGLLAVAAVAASALRILIFYRALEWIWRIVDSGKLRWLNWSLAGLGISKRPGSMH